MLIIGSTAARHWFPDWRAPKDLDVLTLTDQKVVGADAKSHPLVPLLIERSSDKTYADPTVLYTLKVSHAYWDIHWDKTMFDIWQFQRRGVMLDQDLHDQLVEMWRDIHGNKKVNLSKSADTFWRDAVKRRYDHEWLHEQVKFYDRPLHEGLHPDYSSILIDRTRFEALPFYLQLKTVMEEVLTVAIERADLGVECNMPQRLMAVKRAHKKLCISMTKGWFAQFCVVNAHRLVGDRSYWLDHFNAVINRLPRKTP